MSNTYTCLSCRLRSIVRRSHQRTLRQQRWVSQASQWRQDVHAPTRNPRSDEAAFRASPRNGQQRHFQDEEGAAVGRYSGKRLAPEQLLDQLQSAPNQRHAPTQRQNQQHARQNSSLRDMNAANTTSTRHERSGPSSLLEPAMFRLRGKAIILNEETEGYDEAFFDAMKHALKATRDPENPKLLFQEVPFRAKFSRWVNRVLDRWIETEFHTNRDSMLPGKDKDAEGRSRLTPYQALKHRTYFNAHPGAGITRTLWVMAKAIVEYHATHTSPTHPPHPAVVEGLHELMSIWHLTMAMNLCSSGPPDKLREIVDAPGFDWSFLPHPATFVEYLKQNQARRDARISLNDIIDMLTVSSFEPISARKQALNEKSDFESSAIVTLGLIQDVAALPGGAQVVKEYEPWMRFVELSLKNVGGSHVPGNLAERMVPLHGGDARRKYYDALLQRFELSSVPLKSGQGPIQKIWEESTSRDDAVKQGPPLTEEFNIAVADGLPRVLPPNSSSSRSNQFTYICIKRLGRACEQLNLQAAERVRQDVTNFKSEHLDPVGKPVPQELYEHMVYSFLYLKSLRTSVQLWEEMVKAGHEPRVKTYTTMMRGSQHLKDLNSMEYFWNKMRQAQIQPDSYAWSTRINGLLTRGHIEAGFKALTEMGQSWLAAAKQAYMKEQGISQRRGKATPEVTAAQLLARFDGDIGPVPRPDVVIMNSAIAPMARGPDQFIPKILAWGRSFGIEPDLVTYNAFLAVAMRHNQGKEALKILKRMQDKKIEVDSNTWTIILTDMLEGGYLDDLEPEEQQAKVFAFLSIVEAQGSQGLDEKGYAMLLSRLLKEYDNHTAGQALITHMTSKGMQINTHIYTIMMGSHLSTDPPNLAAADALWEHINSEKGGYGAVLDDKFFNLMIKHYAPYHATVGIPKVLSFLDRMEKEGKKPSWASLDAIARALAETGEWARLAQIVDRTRRRLKDLRGIDSGKGQWSFWQFIISTGMLKHERITMPEQIMGMT